jgi:AcrR family transcriptional regulator
LERLPAGGDRFQAELLSRDQRERILRATYDIVAKRGYQGTSVELIVKRAGVARATFYEYFENREACLLAAFDAAEAALAERIGEAVDPEAEWADQVKAGLVAFLGHVAEETAVGRTCLIESMTAGPTAMERYEQAMRRVAPAFARGRALPTASDDLPETLEDSIVGGIAWMVHQRLLRGEADQIPGLLGTMLEFALAPYLGEERAAEIARS